MLRALPGSLGDGDSNVIFARPDELRARLVVQIRAENLYPFSTILRALYGCPPGARAHRTTVTRAGRSNSPSTR
jgi:hypothetical protein